MPNEQLNIHQKLLKIADAAGFLQKTKEGYNYKYVPEEDVQAKVTAGMQKFGVILYPSITPGTLKVIPHVYEKYDNKLKDYKRITEIIVTADTVYKWVNAEKPDEYVEIPWILVGQMEDAAQAFGAAETYCNRYFLLKSLQLATSEADPDDYRSKQKAAENYESEKIAKAVAEELNKAIQDIIKRGSELINAGVSKDSVYDAIAKLNNGNPNPKSIKSFDVCNAILLELGKVQVDTAVPAPTEKPAQEPKTKKN